MRVFWVCRVPKVCVSHISKAQCALHISVGKAEYCLFLGKNP